MRERKARNKKVHAMAGPGTPTPPNTIQPGVTPPSVAQQRQYLKDALAVQFLDPARAAEVAAVIMALALQGNMEAIKFAFERLEGKVVSRSESGKPGDFRERRDAIVDAMDTDTTNEIIQAMERFKRKDVGENEQDSGADSL